MDIKRDYKEENERNVEKTSNKTNRMRYDNYSDYEYPLLDLILSRRKRGRLFNKK